MIPSPTKQTPIKSPLRWPGGKQKAVKKILAMFPKSAQEYREPFVGGGSVFLAAKQAGFAKDYWINDLDEDVIAFWQSASHNKELESICAKLLRTLDNHQDTEQLRYLYEKLKNRPVRMSRIEAAYRFFVLNRVTFSGTTQSGGFSPQASTKRFTRSSISRLEAVGNVMSGVTITAFPYEYCLKPNDTSDVFCFIDPPYVYPDRLYGINGNLQEFDHSKLARLLKETKHKFLATYDDCPEVRELYSWANITPFTLQYSMPKADENKHRRRGNELFIYNYQLGE